MKNSGWFFNMAERCFCLVFCCLFGLFWLVGWCFVVFCLHFKVLMVLWYVFWVFRKVANVSNMFVIFSPVFFVFFLGWLILVYLVLEGLR